MPRRGRSRPEQALPLLVVGVLLCFYLLIGTQRLQGPLPPFAAYAGVAIGYAATFIDLRLGLGLILVGISLSPEIGTGSLRDLRMEDLIVPAVALAWATQLILRRNPLATSPLKEPILGYLFVGLFSIFLNEAARAYPLQRAGLVYFKMVDYFLIFLLVLNNVKTRREAEVFIFLMLATAGLSGVYGVGLSVTQPIEHRLAGPAGEGANVLGGYYAFHIAIAAGLLFYVTHPLLKIALGIYCAGILGVPLIKTQSRASLVCLGAGIAVVFWHRKRVLLWGLPVLAALLPFLLPARVAERVETLGAFLPTSDRPLPPAWTDRVEAWQIALKRDILQAPVFGKGIGAYAFAYVDNEYVKVLIETGLLGFAFFAWLLWKMLKTARAAHHEGRDPLFCGYALGYLAGLCAMMVHAMTATTFTTIRTMEPIMFATGLLGAIYRIEASEPTRDAALPRATAPPARIPRP